MRSANAGGSHGALPEGTYLPIHSPRLGTAERMEMVRPLETMPEIGVSQAHLRSRGVVFEGFEG